MKTAAAAIKEEEIRPEDVFNEFMALSAADAENFFDRSQFMTVPCPACGHAHRVDDFVKHSFHYGACASCGTVYVSPRPNPAELLRYYAQSKSQSFWADTVLKRTGEQRKGAIMLPALERIETLLAERGKKPASVLDVGAATGAFLSEWKNRHPSTNIIAIEPGEVAAEKCRATGATVFEGFLETEAGKPGAQSDLVTCFEVLEHVQEPASFAKALYDVTAPGGLAVTTCLGIDGFDIQVMWENSRSLMPPYHLNFLSSKGMETMFKKAGFSKVEVLTPGRLDVEIVQRAISRGVDVKLSRFEKFLLSKGPETLAAFQKFLAENGLSSHVWIICHRT
jgi:SAM-dependent methyltransferase